MDLRPLIASINFHIASHGDLTPLSLNWRDTWKCLSWFIKDDQKDTGEEVLRAFHEHRRWAPGDEFKEELQHKFKHHQIAVMFFQTLNIRHPPSPPPHPRPTALLLLTPRLLQPWPYKEPPQPVLDVALMIPTCYRDLGAGNAIVRALGEVLDEETVVMGCLKGWEGADGRVRLRVEVGQGDTKGASLAVSCGFERSSKALYVYEPRASATQIEEYLRFIPHLTQSNPTAEGVKSETLTDGTGTTGSEVPAGGGAMTEAATVDAPTGTDDYGKSRGTGASSALEGEKRGLRWSIRRWFSSSGGTEGGSETEGTSSSEGRDRDSEVVDVVKQ